MKKYSDNDIESFINFLDFTKIEGELIPVVAQDYKSNVILILAFANKEAVRRSLKTGSLHYYSRSRKKIWKKGEESGHFQKIKEILTDCDKDSILFKVKQRGGACHLGYYSCFFNKFEDGKLKIIGNKVFEPDRVYKSQTSND